MAAIFNPRCKEQAVDFNLNPRNESYRKRIRDFVEQELLPLEQNPEAYD